jgi:UDP-glucose 4-epimerase
MVIKIKIKIAVIGAGFIGRPLIKNLISKGFEVKVLDRNPCPLEFEGLVTWISSDIHDLEALKLVLSDVFVAYHLISSTVPGDGHIDVATELNENVIEMLAFIEACLEVGVKRIVFSSSASVYGIQSELPVRESAVTNPISVHGIHKLTVEKFLLLASYTGKIEARIFRIANPYGPGQSIDGRQGFIAMAIGSILRNSPVVLRNSGQAIRDFIYIDDLVEALALGGLKNDLPSVMNISSGTGHSLAAVVEIIARLLGKSIEVTNVRLRLTDIPSSILCNEVMQKNLLFTPTFSIRDGLYKMLQHHNLIASIHGGDS